MGQDKVYRKIYDTPFTITYIEDAFGSTKITHIARLRPEISYPVGCDKGQSPLASTYRKAIGGFSTIQNSKYLYQHEPYK
jgi:hypothetical protein